MANILLVQFRALLLNNYKIMIVNGCVLDDVSVGGATRVLDAINRLSLL
jgi:hypothetical protein